MASINIPGTDLGADAKFQQFATGTAANAVALGLEPPQIEAISDAANDFSAKLAASNAAKEAATGAVFEKEKSKATTTSTIRTYAQIVKNAPGATGPILAACGITPGETPSGALAPVTELSSIASSNGSALLKWNRNGNPSGTTFLVQYSLSESGPWLWLGTTTKSRFTDGGAIPGTFKMYRVISQRSDMSSMPSSETVIYGGLEESFLSEAA